MHVFETGFLVYLMVTCSMVKAFVVNDLEMVVGKFSVWGL
jgi:hypothetical protein